MKAKTLHIVSGYICLGIAGLLLSAEDPRLAVMAAGFSVASGYHFIKSALIK